MKRSISYVAALSLFLVGIGQVSAGIVYTNGPINGSVTAYYCQNGYFYNSVSDSFTVSSATNLSGATSSGIWTNPGASPSSLTWSIGTSPFASDVSSGTTSSLTNSFFGTAFGFYSVWSVAFPLSGAVGVGTYYFTITNGVATDGGTFAWDVNSGPSTAYQINNGQIPSESFTLVNASGVPEPASLTLVGIGVVSLVGYGLRRRKQAA